MVVYFPSPPEPGFACKLEQAAGQPVRVVEGERPVDYGVLIEGRPEEAMLSAESLRTVIVPFAGVPVQTLELLRERPNLALYNLHHNAADTAEVAVALLLAAGKQIVPMDRRMRRDDWSPRYAPSTAFAFEGKTALVLGYGEIGRRVGTALEALGLNVLPVTKSGSKGSHPMSDLSELLPKAQVLMIALPATAETKGLIGPREIALLPTGGILVNIARGPIVDEEALFTALKNGHLHSAGLDVWYQYPQAVGDSVPTYFSMPDSAMHTPPSRFPFHDTELLRFGLEVGASHHHHRSPCDEDRRRRGRGWRNLLLSGE